jgi:hypothetical protein
MQMLDPVAVSGAKLPRGKAKIQALLEARLAGKKIRIVRRTVILEARLIQAP